LRRDRDAPILERLFESPKLGSNRRQECDIAQSTRPHHAILAPDRSISDEAAAEIGDAVRFSVAHLVGVDVVPVGNIQRGDCDHTRLRLAGRRQLGEAGLSRSSRQYGLELVIDEAQNRLDRTEVRGDLQQPLVADGRACADVGVHIGVSKTIDRLFGIADDKQRPRTKSASERFCTAVPVSLPAEPPENFEGVLELVDQNVLKSTRECLARLFVSGQEITRRIQQVVEIEQRGGVFV
jgi:hypothetical protein